MQTLLRRLRLALPAVSLAALLILPGCACPEKAALVGIDSAWKVIGPEYRAYVQADPRLTNPEDRADRLRTADMVDRLIAEARKPR